MDVQDEIKILIKVRAHPNVLHFIDHFEDDKSVYLVTELVTGGDLFSAIVDEGQFSETMVNSSYLLLLNWRCCKRNDLLCSMFLPQAAKLAKEMAQALHYIHQSGVTHRDLKPENVLLTCTPLSKADVKICDFGTPHCKTNTPA